MVRIGSNNVFLGSNNVEPHHIRIWNGKSMQGGGGAQALAHDAPLYGCGDDAALTRPTTSKPHMADKASHGIRHSHDYSVASVHGATAAAGGDGIPRRRSPPVSFFSPQGRTGRTGPDERRIISGSRPAGPYVRMRGRARRSGRVDESTRTLY